MLPFPTNDSATLVRAALEATERLYRSGYCYHKAGRLMVAVDALNRQFGDGTVHWAAEGVQQGWGMRSEWRWQSRSERASHRFTTRWDEVAVVR